MAGASAQSVEGLLAGLNEPQRDAVTSGEGPLLILAGAGSGKTRVLTHRIAYLMATGQARADEILAITFTNKAAQEMRDRVELLVGRATRAMWVMTFHSACARMLRADAHRLGYTRQFTIYDAADQRRAIKRWPRRARHRRQALHARGDAVADLRCQEQAALRRGTIASSSGATSSRPSPTSYEEYERSCTA
jgi:superfamily I DNA/RNA helicase